MRTTFYNTASSKIAHDVRNAETLSYAHKLASIAQDITYTKPESALTIIGDSAYQANITKKLSAFKKVRQVLLVGIGGSSLGTEAIYHALKTAKSPILTVIDSVQGDTPQKVTAALASVTSLADIAVVVVSKSGTTLETIAHADYVLHTLQKRFGNAASSRVIYISNAQTPLQIHAEKAGSLFFEIPQVIGGRYSVFSAVGIVPLTLLGIDIKSLLQGAQKALSKKELAANADRASTLTAQAQSGVSVFDFFVFDNRLTKIGFWYRQLLAESTGKETTHEGVPNTTTMVPTVSTAIDLHSIGQLYFSGKKSITTRFLVAPEPVSSYHFTRTASATLPILEKKTPQDVQRAITVGVLTAYKKQKLSHSICTLQNIDASEIGFLLASLMVEVMCIAHALQVNAFNQPNVEAYKKYATRQLSKKRGT